MAIAKAMTASLKQAICSRNFIIGVIGVVVILFLSSIEDIMGIFRRQGLLANGFYSKMIFTALSSDGMMLALPILCTLPFTASFIDDMKSGFIKEYLPRTTVKRYIWSKIAACAVSGGLVISLGVFIAYFICALLLSPMEAASSAVTNAASNTITNAASSSEPNSPSAIIELLGKVLPLSFSGSFWAMVGMTLASVTNSKYMAYASPFVAFYVLIILHERYFKNLYVLYPKEWLFPSHAWVLGNAGIMLLLTELTILVALGFAACVRRRISRT